MMIELYDYQKESIAKLHTGCILCGGVGSGKSRTSIAYYYISNGGDLEHPEKVKNNFPDLYIITTARKRDTCEWESELVPFLMGRGKNIKQGCNITIDSWNNIKKYKDVEKSFFIFDEQRVVGYGAWVKSFLSIAKKNDWILLSATPGDTWMDYVPVFIANGFYKNKTEFTREHVVYSRYSKFPKVDYYIHTGKLTAHSRAILVNMDYQKKTTAHHVDIFLSYDHDMYKRIIRTRWDPYENKPIKNASGLCYLLRKVSNISAERIAAVKKIVRERKRVIIFYNFDYELTILKNIHYTEGTVIAEWNGHVHETLPSDDKWVYLVNYMAGSEGWNCTTTDTIIFYSQSYSYKTMVQASGRIDRLNSPYSDLYYYHLKTRSSIDLAIAKALKNKKKFEESKFVEGK